MTPIGIDISKDYFDVCRLNGQNEHIIRIQQKQGEISAFIKTLPKDALCVMESTGNYGYRLAHALYQAGVSVSVVNAYRIKQFSNLHMRRAKTDVSDAKLIRLYAEKFSDELPRYQPKSDATQELGQLQSALEQLLKQKLAIANQAHAHSHLPKQAQSKAVRQVMDKVLGSIEKAIKELESRIEAAAKQADETMYQCLLSIPAIGKRTAALLMSKSEIITQMASAKQLSAFFGLCPTFFQSGTSQRTNGHISKRGDPYARSLFYVCAWTAAKNNPPCRNLYARLLAKGKPKMLALIAVANKLLRQCFAIIKSKKNYDQTLAFNP